MWQCADPTGQCTHRVAHGHEMPRTVVQPHPDDARFLVLSFDDTQIVVDRGLAKLAALAILSVT